MMPIPKSDPSPSDYRGHDPVRHSVWVEDEFRERQGVRHSWVPGAGGVYLSAVNYAFRVSSPADSRCLCASDRSEQGAGSKKLHFPVQSLSRFGGHMICLLGITKER
jgi:hypothetical protein